MANKITEHKSFWAGLGVIVATVFVASVLVVTLMRPSGMMRFNFEKDVSVSSAGYGGGAPMMYAYERDSAATFSGNTGMMKDLYYPEPAPTAGDTAAEAEPKIIRTGSLSIEVDSAREKTTSISTIATEKGGFVQSSNVQEDEAGNVWGYVTIRVPEEKFDETMSAIRALASRVETDSTNGQDVTEQYTDLEARLRNAQAKEERYLEILEKATDVEDILAVEQYLSQVRYEIESLEGQIKYLSNQTSYSTISVTLFEGARVEVPTAKFDLLRDMKEALRAVILLTQAFITFLIWFIIIGGAFALPVALIVYVVYKIVRRMLNKR